MGYEYKIETLKGLGLFFGDKTLAKAEQVLNEFGAEGWELVGVSPNHNSISGGTLSITAFFKRKK